MNRLPHHKLGLVGVSTIIVVGYVVHASLIILGLVHWDLHHCSMNILASKFVLEFELIDVLLDLPDLLALSLKHGSVSLFQSFDSSHHDIVQMLGLAHH